MKVGDLKEIKDIFDKCGVDFWLEYGTLLGAVRDGELIPWDTDIDLGTWDKNFSKLRSLSKEFYDKGYDTYFSFHTNFLVVKKERLSVDVVFWRLNGDEAIAPLCFLGDQFGLVLFNLILGLLSEGYTRKDKIKGFLLKVFHVLPQNLRLHFAIIIQEIAKATRRFSGVVVMPVKYFTQLSEIELGGIKFNVPADTEEYLFYCYGEGWEFPDKDWKTEHLLKRVSVDRNWEFRVRNK